MKLALNDFDSKKMLLLLRLLNTTKRICVKKIADAFLSKCVKKDYLHGMYLFMLWQ
jgi:hypothetical protein